MPQLQAYRELLDHACAMLSAARDQRWEEIAALELERGQLLARMTGVDQGMSRETLLLLEEMMQTVLDCDRQTALLVHLRQQELHGLLGSADTSRKLAQAYYP